MCISHVKYSSKGASMSNHFWMPTLLYYVKRLSMRPGSYHLSMFYNVALFWEYRGHSIPPLFLIINFLISQLLIYFIIYSITLLFVIIDEYSNMKFPKTKLFEYQIHFKVLFNCNYKYFIWLNHISHMVIRQ